MKTKARIAVGPSSDAWRLAADSRVLTGAWRRVLRAAALYEWMPRLELESWRIDPDRHLAALQNDLERGKWRPDEFPEVPYLKRGAKIRHYVQPSVRDQVAFMACYLTLAPWYEAHFLDLSFGNRWARPRQGPRAGTGDRWRRAPFRLVDDDTYESFAESYGAFERYLRATAEAMVDIEPDDRPDDDRALPWARREAWSADQRQVAGAWMKFDLKSAYLSVDRGILRERLERLSSDTSQIEPWSASVQRWPHDIIEQVKKKSTRRALARVLADRLDDVCYVPHDEARRASGSDPPVDQGLPTGLLISGALFNVYLHDADVAARARWTGGADTVATLRFSDDFYLFGRSVEQVNETQRAIVGVIGGDVEINIAKVVPVEWRERLKGEGPSPIPLLRQASVSQIFRRYSQVLSGLDEERSSDRIDDRRQRRAALTDLVHRPAETVQIHGGTVVVFAVHRLVRAMPADTADLAHYGETRSVRRVVEHALVQAPDRPALWRQVVRVACRPEPIGRSGSDLDLRGSVDWLKTQLRRIRVVPPDSSDPDSWWCEWPSGRDGGPDWDLRRDIVMSILRTSFWRALVEVLAQLDSRRRRAEVLLESPPEAAWHVRNIPDSAVGPTRNMISSVEVWAKVLYGEAGPDFHLDEPEVESVSAAVLRSTTAGQVAASTRARSPEETSQWNLSNFAQTVLEPRDQPTLARVLATAGKRLARLPQDPRKLSLGELEILPLAAWDPALDISEDLLLLANVSPETAVFIAHRLHIQPDTRLVRAVRRSRAYVPGNAQPAAGAVFDCRRRALIRDVLLGEQT